MLSLNGALKFLVFHLVLIFVITTLFNLMFNLDPYSKNIRSTMFCAAVVYVIALIIALGNFAKYNFAEGVTTIFSGSLLLVSLLSVFQLLTGSTSDANRFSTALSLFSMIMLASSYCLVLYIFINKKCFGKWSMVASSLALYFPTGLFFASLYKLFPESLNNVSSNFDYVYFSFITLSSTGYGDITPKGNFAKFLASIEPFVGGYMILGLFIASALGLSEKPQISEIEVNSEKTDSQT